MIHSAGAANPQALLHACFGPLLAAPGFTQHQAELLSRAAKDWLPPSLLPELLLAACSASGGAGGGAGGGPGGVSGVSADGAGGGPAGSHWNEHVVGLVQAILGAKPELSQVRCHLLCWGCS